MDVGVEGVERRGSIKAEFLQRGSQAGVKEEEGGFGPLCMDSIDME